MPETWKYLPFPPGPETETGYRNLRATRTATCRCGRPPMGSLPTSCLPDHPIRTNPALVKGSCAYSFTGRNCGRDQAFSRRRTTVSYVDRPNATTTVEVTRVGVSRSVSTQAATASSSGQPYTPADTSGTAREPTPSSSATASAFA